MKKPALISLLALIGLGSASFVSGQNLPASMAYTDESAYQSLNFLDVAMPVTEGQTVAEIMENDHEADQAARPVISHTSAAVLSLLGLLCLTGRKSR